MPWRVTSFVAVTLIQVRLLFLAVPGVAALFIVLVGVVFVEHAALGVGDAGGQFVGRGGLGQNVLLGQLPAFQ